MADEQRNTEVVRQVAERWNAGDLEGVLELYAEDIEMISDPQWPDPGTVGKENFRRYSEEWREAWASAKIDIGRLQAAGEHVIADGNWDVEAAATGISGQMPFTIVFTLQDGLVVRHEWFLDPAAGRRAAGLG